MTPLSGIDVARLEEARQARAVARIACETRPFADGVMCYSAPGSWSNTAVGVGLSRTPTPEEIDGFEAWYAARGVEPRLELTPFVAPEFIAMLAVRGYTLRGFESTLARSIDQDQDLLAESSPPEGLRLEVVDPSDASLVDQFVHVVMSGFTPPGESPEPSMIETARRAVHLPGAVSIAAWLDGPNEPTLVGGAGMEMGTEIAALYGVTVLEPYRRRGIQQAMVIRRLELARRAGCRVATIGSKPGMGTERNAMRMGFQLAYTRVALAKAGEGLVASPA